MSSTPLWLPSSHVQKLSDAEQAELKEAKRQLHVMNRALNQIQRGLSRGEDDWTKKIAKDALIEACGEIWT